MPGKMHARREVLVEAPALGRRQQQLLAALRDAAADLGRRPCARAAPETKAARPGPRSAERNAGRRDRRGGSTRSCRRRVRRAAELEARRPQVDDAAANRDFALLVDGGHLAVAGGLEPGHELLEQQVVADNEVERDFGERVRRHRPLRERLDGSDEDRRLALGQLVESRCARGLHVDRRRNHLQRRRLAGGKKMHPAREEAVVRPSRRGRPEARPPVPPAAFSPAVDDQRRAGETVEYARQHVGRRTSGEALDPPRRGREDREFLAQRSAKLGSRDVRTQERSRTETSARRPSR